MAHQAKQLVSLVIVALFTINGHADSDSLCGGHYDFINFINRPTNIDSPCVLPQQAADLETGARYLSLYSAGEQYNLPQAELRYGFADKFEVFVILPNYLHQTVSPAAGFTATSFGAKHELVANKKWVGTIEAIITSPSGSYGFGSQGTGVALNGITQVSLTSHISFSGSVGYSSQSEPSYFGGHSYSSFNPDVLLSWSINAWSFFAEIYGQTKTANDQGSGFNSDVGFLYLLKKNIIVDCEFGQRLSGQLGGFRHYVGAGISFQLF